MLRRNFLFLAAAQTLSPQFRGEESFGWIPNHSKRIISWSHLKGFGENKVACLWKLWKKVIGKEWIAHDQKHTDCVAQATGSGMDILTAVRIIQGKSERYITKSSTDAIYSGGRNNIAHGYVSHGMIGMWAVKYLQEYGNLLRQKYGNIDLTNYSEQSCVQWENKKLPESLLKEAKEHPLLDFASVNTFTEIRDAVAAGFPVLFCSDLGFKNSTRDKDGFCKPRGTWYHAWVIAGIDDGRRPGVCLLNSFGKNWASGPKRHNQPDGSIWVDKRHLRIGEAYALSNYKGFPEPERKYILW